MGLKVSPCCTERYFINLNDSLSRFARVETLLSANELHILVLFLAELSLKLEITFTSELSLRCRLMNRAIPLRDMIYAWDMAANACR